MDLTIALVSYRNEEKTIKRWEKDIRPALASHWNVEVFCVDNSPHVSNKLKEISAADPKFHYIWNEGENWQYSKSLNYIVSLAKTEIFLYVCTQHGYAIDDTWINDIIQPLLDSPSVAMTGCLVDNMCHKVYGELFFKFPNNMPTKHIQGGVFAGRTEAFRKCPYPEKDIPHNYSDIYITAELLYQGYDIAHVRSIKSVWNEEVNQKDRLNYKFIHDCGDRRWADKLREEK